MDTPGFDPEADLTDLETRLARLRPAPIALDRDRLLFEAGRASARSEARAWVGYAIAAGFALVAVGLGGLVVREQGERRVLETTIAARERKAIAPRPILTPNLTRAEAISPYSLLALTRHFLDRGLDGLETEAPKTLTGSGRVVPRDHPEPLRVRGPRSYRDLL